MNEQSQPSNSSAPSTPESAGPSGVSSDPEASHEEAAADSFEIALAACQSAVPYCGLLITRLQSMVESLRNGNDNTALAGLSEIADDLQDFLTFIVLAGEMLQEKNPEMHQTLETYRRKIVGAIEGLQPALTTLDLVEVADAIEYDVVQSLSEYKDLHEPVEEALRAAA